MLRFATDPSGGWRYHLRAFRGQSRWKEFQDELAQFLRPWLEEQRQRDRRVLLIGASAGHTLPWDLLRVMPDLAAIEPDPLARYLLRRKAPALKVDPNPALGWTPQGYCVEALERWFSQVQGCALLFCNVLGQLETPKTLESPAWCRTFLSGLEDRAWMSFHDLVSSEHPADLRALRALAPSYPCLTPERAMPLWQQVYAQCRAPLHLVDHKTAALFKGKTLALRERRFFLWPLCPGRWHVIEGLVSAT